MRNEEQKNFVGCVTTHRFNEAHLLADIGNSRVHIYDGKEVLHLLPDEAIAKFGTEKLNYISVNTPLETRIRKETVWTNVSDKVHIPGEYETMGVDRRALCLSRDNALFIDAGSAITVDKVQRGVYMGGFILPGIAALQKAYADVSEVLDVPIDVGIDTTRLHRTTDKQISYGIIASIKSVVEAHRGALPVYVTGGDGEKIASLFAYAEFDETLIFKGMRYALDANEI